MKKNNKKNEDSFHLQKESESLSQNSDQEYNYFLNENEYHIEIEIINQNRIHQCRKCRMIFFFNNKLHRHIRECFRKNKFDSNVETFHVDESRIIVFKTKFDLFKDLVFRSWHFATFFARICNDFFDELCANIDCIMSLIDRDYLMKILS